MRRKISEFSKYIETLSAEELMLEIKKLYKLFPVIQQYYQVQLQDHGEDDLLEQCKRAVEKAFSVRSDFTGPRLRDGRKAVNDFIKLSTDGLHVADVMIYYAEMGVKFTNQYGDINEAFYSSIEGMYEKAAQYVTEQQLHEQFFHRFHKMVSNTADIGWGFHDNLSDIFNHYFPVVAQG